MKKLLFIIGYLLFSHICHAQFRTYNAAVRSVQIHSIRFKKVELFAIRSRVEDTAIYKIQGDEIIFSGIGFSNKLEMKRKGGKRKVLINFKKIKEDVICVDFSKNSVLHRESYTFKKNGDEFMYFSFGAHQHCHGIILFNRSAQWAKYTLFDGLQECKAQLGDFDGDGQLDFLEMLPFRYYRNMSGYYLRLYTFKDKKWVKKKSKYDKMCLLRNDKTGVIRFYTEQQASKLPHDV